MQENHIYEYAVIRVLPIVEREEFVNVGIILFCKKAKFIQVHYKVNEAKLNSFSKDLDVAQISGNLQSFQNIALGLDGCGPVAKFDIHSRFRWLTAIRSSAIQTSRPHPGICINLEQTTQRLFEEMVL